MKALSHPRIQKLLLVNRMDESNPHPGNYIEGLTELIDDFITPQSIVAEIGSFRGVSSEAFALFCKQLYCIDWWGSNPDYWWNQSIGNLINEAEDDFNKVLNQYSNIKKYKGSSLDMVKRFPEEYLDLIYIDADHDEFNFKQDLENWSKKVKPSGTISGHDYPWVGSYLEDYVDSSIVKVYKDGSWAFKKQYLK